MVWAATAPVDAARALADGSARYVLELLRRGMGDTAVLDGRGPGEVHGQEQLEQSLEVPFGWFPQPV